MTRYIPQTVTLTLMQDAYGNISAATDSATPTVGAPLAPVQSLGLQIVAMMRHADIPVAHGAKHVPALELLLDLTNPDQYGWAAPADVRAAITNVLHRSQHHAPVHGTQFANGSMA